MEGEEPFKYHYLISNSLDNINFRSKFFVSLMLTDKYFKSFQERPGNGTGFMGSRIKYEFLILGVCVRGWVTGRGSPRICGDITLVYIY